jgi:polyhydroxyalkanoate synthesis repressor PhaR
MILPAHNYLVMTQDASSTPQLIQIRKYPNRRYYDSTRSKHLTLEDIHALIRQGCDVRVVDSQTSADITAKVLTQIILELDAPKLDLFPATLLTHLIRLNDQFVKGFFEKCLLQAVEAFAEYQKQFGAQMQPGAVWPPFLSPMTAWTRAVANPLSPPALAQAPVAGPGGVPAAQSSLSGVVERLQERLQILEGRLAAKRRRSSRKSAR